MSDNNEYSLRAPFPHPANWKVQNLRDVCSKIGSGATPTGGQANYLPSRENWALVRSQNVFDRRFDETGLAYITDEQAATLGGVVLQAEDVLLNITGDGVTFARSCQIPGSALPAVVNQHVSIVRPKPDLLNPGFLLAYLTHPETKHYIEGFNAGGSRRAVTKRHIEAFSIPLPPLPIQQDIAHILGTLDDKIELNRRMNETLEAMARAIFKSWFVDFDPVRAKASGEPPESIRRRLGLTPEVLALFPDAFNDSELGEIPAGWGVDTLKGLTSKIGSGATPRGGREVYLDEGVSLIRSQNVYDANFVWEGLAHISDEAAKQLAGVEVNTGDVLINITGASILRTCVVDPDVLPARVNQHVAIIRGKPGIPPRYLHLHLLDPETKTYLMGLNAGASREAVTKGHLESVPVLNPGPALLERFGNTVAPMYAEIEQLTHQGRVLQAIRDTLLPKLLSGDIATNNIGSSAWPMFNSPSQKPTP